MIPLFKKYLSLDRLIAIALFTASANVLAVSHVGGEVPYENIEATVIPLVDGPKTILGQSFKYPSGTPLINAFNINIPVGKKTSLHKQ